MLRSIFLVGLAILVLVPSAPARADAPVTHTVAWGETLYSIARTYGVTPQAIAAANRISVDSWVYAGTRLTIPGNSVAAVNTATTPSGFYAVRAGDTLFSIAERFGVSTRALALANDLPQDGLLYVGWSLKISAAGSTPAARPVSTRTYIVQQGDYLAQVALKHGVTANAIAQANNLPNQWFIYAGQRLTIPVSGAPGGGTSAAAAGASAGAPSGSTSAPAVAAPQYRASGIPLYRQQQTLTCEESAAAMATRGAISEARLVAVMPRSDNPFSGIRGATNSPYLGGLNDYGAYAQAIQRGLSTLGVKSQVLYGQPYDDFKAAILTHLQTGHPVIWWNTFHESYQTPVMVKTSSGALVKLVPYEHAGVIIAANDRGVTYNDPYDATVRFVSWGDHRRISEYFDNMALIVP